MKNRITFWNNSCLQNPNIIWGFALACAGTKRVAYLTRNKFLYEENKANIYSTRQDAINDMINHRELWPYLRIVIMKTKDGHNCQFPTINGY